MKTECKIIQDILPLYVENMASDETNTFVEKHLAGCSDCQSLLNNMKQSPEIPVKLGAVPLKYLKRKLLKKRVATIVFTAAIILAIVTTGFAFLTSPQYLPYSKDIISITETENGILICSFSDEITGYNVRSTLSAIDGDKTIAYFVSAWNTVWDEYFIRHDKQNLIIEPVDGKQITVFYSLNNGTEDVFIYGAEPDYHVQSLPRLVLSYYLMMAVITGVGLAVFLLIFRKKPITKLWIERLLLFPVSYIISHVCIKGFSVATYSSQRDFLIILLVTILIYLTCLLGINLYRIRKGIEDV